LILYRKEEKRETWNAAFIPDGKLPTGAIKWNTITVRNAWTNVGPAPIRVIIARPAPVASSGKCAAKRPRNAARKKRTLLHKGRKNFSPKRRIHD